MRQFTTTRAAKVTRKTALAVRSVRAWNVSRIEPIEYIILQLSLQVFPEKIRLLPALPSKWESGSLLGIMTRCGVKADVIWNEGGVSATLEAIRDTSFKLKVKDGKYERITLKKGEKYVI